MSDDVMSSQQLALLFDATTALLATDDPLAFLDGLYDRLSAHLDLGIYAHFAVSPDGTHLKLAASGGLTPECARSLRRLEFGQAVCGTVAETRQPMSVSHVQSSEDPLTGLIRSLGITAYVCHPLTAKGELFGTLSFGTTARSSFDKESVALVRAVSDLVALAIARHRTEQSLREAHRRKDEYLATLAHELRNPLAAIRSATELLKHAALDDAESFRRAQGVLDRQSLHMARLLDGLLEVSRISRGKVALECRTLDLRELVEALMFDRADEVAKAGLEAEFELGSEPIWVMADDARLAQVLDNLLGNAVNFTASPGRIAVVLRTDEASAIVRVRDTGAGIAPEDLLRIFEPFQQGTQKAVRATNGLGLGLALAKGLVELHGGTIEADSAGQGSGAQFEIRLPLAPSAPVLERPEPLPQTEPRRVLLVEDNADAACVLRDLLQMRGHEVTAARDGAEALDLLRKHGADVVLCDIGLPGMSGYQLAQAVRSDYATRGVSLVALTGYGQPVDRRRAAEAGFDDHLTKPADLASIDAVVRRLAGSSS